MMLRILLVVALLVPGFAVAQTPARTPLPIAGTTALYQRVIARPGATISPTAGGAFPQPVPGFSVFYVYGRQGGDDGWIEVGAASDGRTQAGFRRQR